MSELCLPGDGTALATPDSIFALHLHELYHYTMQEDLPGRCANKSVELYAQLTPATLKF